MKALMLMACMVVSSAVGASEQVYDYQGLVMTGVGGPETFRAELDSFGPISNPSTAVGVTISFSGTYSGSYSVRPCPLNTCADPENTLIVQQINESHGQFTSADITFRGMYGGAGPVVDGIGLDIGRTGDSFVLQVIGGPPITVVSAANSTPGIWTERAPELGANGAFAAMTLLAGCLLMSMGKRPHG
jgi:hypothetical protein